MLDVGGSMNYSAFFVVQLIAVAVRHPEWSWAEALLVSLLSSGIIYTLYRGVLWSVKQLWPH